MMMVTVLTVYIQVITPTDILNNSDKNNSENAINQAMKTRLTFHGSAPLHPDCAPTPPPASVCPGPDFGSVGAGWCSTRPRFHRRCPGSALAPGESSVWSQAFCFPAPGCAPDKAQLESQWAVLIDLLWTK